MVTVACSVNSVNADPPVDPLYSEAITTTPVAAATVDVAASSNPIPAPKNLASKAPAGSVIQPVTAVAAAPSAPTVNAAPPAELATQPAGNEEPAASALQDNSNARYQSCEQQYLAALDTVPLRYHATYKSIGVDSTRRLKSLGDERWQLSSEAELLFMRIDETSEFHLPDWQLLGFNHQRKGMTDRHNLAVTVDPENAEFSAKARGKTQVYNYQGVLFDELNHQLKLQLDVACRPQQNRFEYLVAKRKGPRQYTYHKRGQESVETNAGRFNAIRLERASEDRTISIWLAPELAYAVVKLVYEDDGESNSLSIKAKPKLPVILPR